MARQAAGGVNPLEDGAVDRDEALNLLRGGPEGIAEWNRRRVAGDVNRELDGVQLAEADLQAANLRGVSFIKANFHRAKLRSADLSGLSSGVQSWRGQFKRD